MKVLSRKPRSLDFSFLTISYEKFLTGITVSMNYGLRNRFTVSAVHQYTHYCILGMNRMSIFTFPSRPLTAILLFPTNSLA